MNGSDLIFASSQSVFRPGMSILDVGSGARPVIPPDSRPARTRYLGLDVSEAELQKAPSGSYDQYYVSDIQTTVPELVGSADLIVSYHVFEHIADLNDAFIACRSYLKPEGRLVAFFPGRFAYFSLLNQLFPHAVTKRLLRITHKRQPESIFPAHYNKCWYSALTHITTIFHHVSITPCYLGAGYLKKTKLPLQLYLYYENWLAQGNHPNLAPYYLLCVER